MKRVSIIFTILFTLVCFPLFSQEKAKPRNGEGLHAFLKRHNCLGKENYQAFIELNKSKLGKNNSLKLGVEYKLPNSANQKKKVSGKLKQPLFGKKYEEYTIKSNRLAGACFYLVSGHGGPDCGAIGKVGDRELHEDEYAYDIMLRLARALLEEGANVHIIIQDAKDGIRDDKFLKNSKIETCMGDEIPLNQVRRLKQRCDKINSLHRKSKESYQRAIFIHLDSRSKKQQTDVYFYYTGKSTASKNLANTLKTTFQEHYDKHQPNRGFTGTVSTRNLYVLNNTTPVSVFTELGNIRNSFDQRRFVESDNRQALANWLCRGFIKDYQKSKKK